MRWGPCSDAVGHAAAMLSRRRGPAAHVALLGIWCLVLIENFVALGLAPSAARVGCGRPRALSTLWSPCGRRAWATRPGYRLLRGGERKRAALSQSARHRSDADIRDEMARMRTRGGLPRHLAIVMDGNRRYAHSRGYPAAVGHLRGKARLEQTIRWVLCDLRIPCLTVYALSLDNISKRAPEELDQLFGLIAQGLDELRTSDDIAQFGIRVKVAGALHALPASAQNVRRAAEAVEAATRAGGTGGLLTICIAYGGREDLVEAARKTALDFASGSLAEADITEQVQLHPDWARTCLYRIACNTARARRTSTFNCSAALACWPPRHY